MAAVASSYPVSVYHQHNNTLSTSFCGAQYMCNNQHKSRSPKQQRQQLHQKRTRTPTPTRASEYVDHSIQHIRPRREPRIRRQVILLPAPEPIYRQVRHRLPTPERKVISRTFVQKANGDVILQHERHRKKTRSQNRVRAIAHIGSPPR